MSLLALSSFTPVVFDVYHPEHRFATAERYRLSDRRLRVLSTYWITSVFLWYFTTGTKPGLISVGPSGRIPPAWESALAIGYF